MQHRKCITDTRRWSDGGSSRELKVHELAHLGRLDLVVSRAHTNPDEVSYIDKYGRSVLHQVVRKKPPLRVVRQILSIYPGAIHQQDIYDRSLIDIALCYDASTDVLNYLESKRIELHNLPMIEESKEDTENNVEALTKPLYIAVDVPLDYQNRINKNSTSKNNNIKRKSINTKEEIIGPSKSNPSMQKVSHKDSRIRFKTFRLKSNKQLKNIPHRPSRIRSMIFRSKHQAPVLCKTSKSQ